MYIEKVVKRNGDVVPFDKQKIVIAIMKAMTDSDEVNKGTALRIANDISKTEKEEVTVEEIQDMVEESAEQDSSALYSMAIQKRNDS